MIGGERTARALIGRKFSREPIKIRNASNGTAVFFLSQSEGLRLSPKGARGIPLVGIEAQLCCFIHTALKVCLFICQSGHMHLHHE